MPAIRSYRCPKPPHRAPRAGTEVKFCGLIGRKHLNGATGTVVTHIDGSLEDATHRCRVQVHSMDYTVKVLGRNLVVIPADSKWNIADRIDVVETPSEDHLALPTSFKLNIDKGCELPVETPPQREFTNRICTSKGQQQLGETYARYKASAAGRDPGRLRHTGLGFFRDNVEEEAHPANNKVRIARTKDTWMHTMRGGHDWRKDGYPMYVDPFHIPVAQGGHAAHVGLNAAMDKDEDEAEGDVPLHPRLRGLLLNEELEPETVYEPIERGYRELLLFTHEKEFLKTRLAGGPLRNAAQKECDFKRKERNRSKLLKTRAALSVRPAQGSELPPPVQWDGKVDIDGMWDPMAWDTKNSMMEADAADSITLEHLLHRQPERGYHWEARVQGSPFAVTKGKDEVQHPSQSEEKPWTEDMINEVLQKSVEDAEKGFDYGCQPSSAGGNAVSAPWYEQEELVSSMLLLDQSASLPSAAGATAVGVGAASANGATDLWMGEASVAADSVGYHLTSQGLSEAEWSQISAAADLALDVSKELRSDGGTQD